jgi:Domain of unknown function (DU1801)
MQSKATTVAAYLAALPPDRRAAISAVRDTILRSLDKDYEEGIQYGMIGYYVPHRVHPAGYHCDPRQPLPFACLASQKNHMSLYLMAVYGDGQTQRWFKDAWAKTGKKLDMGKSCIRFRSLEDLPLEVIGEVIRRVPARKYIEQCVAAVGATSASGTGRRAGASPTRARRSANGRKKSRAR